MAKDYNPSARNRAAFESMTDVAGTVPPQAVELEEAVLGALMLERDSIIAVQEYITPAAFYTEEHRLIYQAIESLSAELKPIDLYTVTERLRSRKELKKVGGAAYLAQLTQRVGSAANVEFHAKIIAQKYVQRELIRSATEIQRRSYDEDQDVNDLIGYAESEIFAVAEGHVKRSVQNAKDVLARAMKQIEDASKNTSAFNGVPSGFLSIDRVTLGWQPSDLIIVAARPSMGKTAFVLSMARNMAIEHNSAVAFFSLEMSSVQLMMRLIVAETGLQGNDVKSGRLTPEQWRHLESATKPLGTAPLYVDDTPALSVFEFRSKARRLKIHNDIKQAVRHKNEINRMLRDTNFADSVYQIKIEAAQNEDGQFYEMLTAKELDIITLTETDHPYEMDEVINSIRSITFEAIPLEDQLPDEIGSKEKKEILREYYNCKYKALEQIFDQYIN